MDVILVPTGPCCGDLQQPLSLFGDHSPFSFYDAISSDAETCSVGHYKVANYQISLTFHRGIKLSTLLALGGWLNVAKSIWPSKPYLQPCPISFSAQMFSSTHNQNIPKGH